MEKKRKSLDFARFYRKFTGKITERGVFVEGKSGISWVNEV
jgi:hypothetical protein